ncbi:hypothetical protein ACFQ0M_37970 [Kitasatospora aburaviensis]
MAALRPVQPLFRARAAQRLAVLAYHGVTDPRSFGAQLDRLRRPPSPWTPSSRPSPSAGRCLRAASW